jgi:hypothetical protein
MKNKIRIDIFDKDGHVQEIWEIGELSSRSRVLDGILENFWKDFPDGQLTIKKL